MGTCRGSFRGPMSTADEPLDPEALGRILGVELVTPDGARAGAQILRVTSTTVELGFQALTAPSVNRRDPATLTFVSRAGDRLSARVRLAGRGEESGQTRLEFVFESPEESRAPTPPRSLQEDPLNNREAVRVHPDPRVLACQVRPFGCAEESILDQLTRLELARGRQTLEGWVYDISSLGIGVDVEREQPVFELGDSVDVTFGLPDRPEPLSLSGRVRHRHPGGIGVRYGIAFDELALASLQRDILAFVMEKQRQDLRYRAV